MRGNKDIYSVTPILARRSSELLVGRTETVPIPEENYFPLYLPAVICFERVCQKIAGDA